ncbi:hypothetical protein BDV25DRAFT_146356 [Aspergillus avenaceus]|uniref:SGNH hydrolase-type esterase domain-containing protein n=1 Tax=Aspergillus avenaceus TaxID=36643 RepID=A0A5N6U9D3_ASPAV|nr:hypothetical protein BDV25DRAFT_146356 [Aspergillus avenaceus]
MARQPISGVFRALFTWLALLSVASAVAYNAAESTTDVALDETPALNVRAEKPFTLRVMPLGASITYGLKSTDGNGYRRWIRQQLRHSGWWVNMVGSRPNGTMSDNESEARSGNTVEKIAQEAEKTIPQQPNLILINAGTNDAVLPKVDVQKTGPRVDALLTRLFDTIPGTTIILSTLLPNIGHQENITIINDHYRELVATRRQKNQRIVLAEMSDFIKKDELVDNTHPDDHGYKKMASVWWAAIQQAEKEGLLQAPNDTGISDTKKTTCEKKKDDNNNEDRVQTQSGNGSDDGKYVHSSTDEGRIFTPATTGNRTEFYAGINYAQLLKKSETHREDALDELVWTKDGDGTYMFINNDGKFGEPVKIDVKDGCLARGVRWGDVNNDGLDDFICISREGRMYVSINENKPDGDVPTFRSIGKVRDQPDGDFGQGNVRLGDIDGDGRIDYCLVHNNGDIQCWRNGGQGDAPTSKYKGYWQDLGIVFTGNMGNNTDVRFVDINGDFRSDLLLLDDQGKVTTYINNRGTGKSLVPDWRSAGVTHEGTGVAGAKNRIKFGRVYAGGADYTLIESEKKDNDWEHHLHVWKNTGHGGTMLKGDGVYYCDIRGAGADDYVWISAEGRGTLYGNVHKPPTWDPEGIEIFNVNKTRKGLHLADFDGDGKCDLWSVDRDTGEAEVWLNKWSDGEGSFEYQGVLTGNASCTQGWGVGLGDLGLRFADLDGDGRADYLCMEENGRTDGWLNKGENKFQSIGQVKLSENYDRANHRWTDVNGDRMADFLWVDKFNGNTKVWINQGPVPIAGSNWKWEVQDGVRYTGVDRGANMHFPNLGGLGRADFHQVIPRTNEAYTWFNECPSGSLDDDDSEQDPELPAYTAPAQPTR